MQKICLVIGAGAGIGGNVGKAFAADGDHVVLCRRSNRESLDTLVSTIEASGGTASGRLINVVEQNAIEDLVADVETNLGPIDTVLFNLGAQIGNLSLADTSYKVFELGWRMTTFALFRTAHAVLPHMQERGTGNLLVTSSTAAMRGNAGQHSHAAAMAGRRMLCQTLNAEFAPLGIHVAHFIIDGAVDAPETLGKMMGEAAFQKLREEKGMEHDGLMLPEKIAETYLHVARQHRSAWTHEIDLRAYSDRAWWN